MKFSWKLASVIAVLALGIIGSFAVAAPRRGGWAKSSEVHRGRAFAGPANHLPDLAKELGVSTSQLREALDALPDKLGPPKLPNPGQRPSGEQIEKRCTDATDALAAELNKGGDEVRAAIKAVIKSHVEKAVAAGRLSRARADKMIERIDSAKCLPLFGPHVAFGCGPGRGRPDDQLGIAPFPGDDERPAGPPIPLGPPAM
jgi:hypothetical protein